LETKIKHSAFFNFAFGPNAAAVAMDDLLYNGQANPCSFIIISAMQPLKNAK
jgi:hypothetical protein